MTQSLLHAPAFGRRRFLNLLTIAAGTIGSSASPLLAWADDGDGTTHEWRGQRRLIRRGRQYFPQSVASFEPRAHSLIVWTRVQDSDYAGQDLELTLLVGTDPLLKRLIIADRVNARFTDGGVVQIKLTALKARTRYYYRFVYEKSGTWHGSAIARTQTAPLPRDASPVRFALASCQDGIGRYYNTYIAALAQEPDFVLHVGDYIYETTGDPSFQTSGGRGVTFSDITGAIPLGTPNAPYYAASSISNYRELYQFYRADPILQRMHERFAFINIWDDHEFSDDCWQATTTYFDGRRDEASVQRRRHAEQVFFEYIPVDADDNASGGQVELSTRPLYPHAQLYREIRYGKNLHVILTDSRSFRPDHLIPEDGFPGTIAVDRFALTALLASRGITYDTVKANFAPYIDLATPAFASLQPVLVQIAAGAYVQAGLVPAAALAKAQAVIQGKLDARVVNQLLGAANIPPLGNIDTLDRGISFAHMGKTALFSTLGARYFVVKDTYDIYAAYLGLLNPASQDVYDSAHAPAHPQRDWLVHVLRTSGARWKMIANSTSFTSMVLDLTGQLPNLPAPVQNALAQLPPALRNRFYLNVDQMEGFPGFRNSLLALLGEHDNTFLVSGDIHASFATKHAGNVWEFTGPAVSSFAFGTGVLGAVQSDPALSQLPGLSALVEQLDLLLRAANPEIKYANTGVNGVVIFDVSPASLAATYWQVDGAEATASHYQQPSALLAKMVPRRIVVDARHVSDKGPGATVAGLAA